MFMFIFQAMLELSSSDLQLTTNIYYHDKALQHKRGTVVIYFCNYNFWANNVPYNRYV
jgi:hypothetical protein